MPLENCRSVGCFSNHRHEEINLFKLPTAADELTKKSRREMLNVIIKDKVIDAHFKK